MNAPSTPRLGTWAIFGSLMLIALLSWSLGAPELGLVLAVGAIGAGVSSVASKFPFLATLRRITPQARI